MKVTELIMNIDKVQIDSKKRKGAEIQDRYYTPQEYAKLSKEQKMKLKGLKDARGHKKPKGDDASSRLDDLKRQIASLQSKIDATDEMVTTSASSISSKTGGTNSDHPG